MEAKSSNHLPAKHLLETYYKYHEYKDSFTVRRKENHMKELDVLYDKVTKSFVQLRKKTKDGYECGGFCDYFSDSNTTRRIALANLFTLEVGVKEIMIMAVNLLMAGLNFWCFFNLKTRVVWFNFAVAIFCVFLAGVAAGRLV